MEIPSFAVMLAAAQLCITAFILRPFAWRPCGRSVAAHARPWPIPAAPGCRPSGPGCGRRHVLTRGHHRCPLSAPFSPRPSSPVCAYRASIQWPQVVVRQGLRSLLTQATVSPDPFAMVRRLPGTHRALPGPEVFCMLVLIMALGSSRFFRAAVTLRAVASLSRLPLRLTFASCFRQPRRRRRLALLGSGCILSLSL